MSCQPMTKERRAELDYLWDDESDKERRAELDYLWDDESDDVERMFEKPAKMKREPERIESTEDGPRKTQSRTDSN